MCALFEETIGALSDYLEAHDDVRSYFALDFRRYALPQIKERLLPNVSRTADSRSLHDAVDNNPHYAETVVGRLPFCGSLCCFNNKGLVVKNRAEKAEVHSMDPCG